MDTSRGVGIRFHPVHVIRVVGPGAAIGCHPAPQPRSLRGGGHQNESPGTHDADGVPTRTFDPCSQRAVFVVLQSHSSPGCCSPRPVADRARPKPGPAASTSTDQSVLAVDEQRQLRTATRAAGSGRRHRDRDEDLRRPPTRTGRPTSRMSGGARQVSGISPRAGGYTTNGSSFVSFADESAQNAIGAHP